MPFIIFDEQDYYIDRDIVSEVGLVMDKTTPITCSKMMFYDVDSKLQTKILAYYHNGGK